MKSYTHKVICVTNDYDYELSNYEYHNIQFAKMFQPTNLTNY